MGQPLMFVYTLGKLFKFLALYTFKKGNKSRAASEQCGLGLEHVDPILTTPELL